MAIITYFLGAGASYQALPVMTGFKERFIPFINMLHEQSARHRYNDRLKTYLYETAANTPDHITIDTVAKGLQLRQDRNKYEAFKLLLSYYFLFEQFKGSEELLHGNIYSSPVISLFAKRMDLRYQTLFKNILNGSNQLKDNVRIISWNYDLQLELTYTFFFNTSLMQAFHQMKIYPTIDNDWSEVYKTKSPIVKLNGTAGICYDNSKGGRNPYYLSIDEKMGFDQHTPIRCLEQLSGWLFDNNRQIESLIKYAWDGGAETIAARTRAKEILSETEILIIIGYSFPRDNKDVDKEIFQNAKKVNHIYYNVPEVDFDNYKMRLQKILPLPVTIENIKDLSDFFIPDDL